MKNLIYRFAAMMVMVICLSMFAVVAYGDQMPDNMVIDEAQWEAWSPQGKCDVFTFMRTANNNDFSYSIPSGQSASHKKASFIFNDKGHKQLGNTEMYYGISKGNIEYVGLWTEKKSIFQNKDFTEACIRLMMAYNIHFDSEQREYVSNLTRKEAEAVVNYCLKNVEHCLVGDLRIRVVQQDDYYSFHMEH